MLAEPRGVELTSLRQANTAISYQIITEEFALQKQYLADIINRRKIRLIESNAKVII
jgi:hypothetical protein